MPIRLWGPERQVTATQSQEPTLAALTGGGFVVVWNDQVQSPDRIMFQIYGADGKPVGAPQSAYLPASKDQYQPSVAALDNGGFFISQTHKFSASDYDIVGAYYSAAGVLGTVVGFPAPGGVQAQSAVAATLSNSVQGIGAVWYDATLNGGDIRFASYGPDGQAWISPITVNSVTAGYQASPFIATKETATAVVWVDSNVNSGDIKLRTINAAGTLGAEVTVNTSVDGIQFEPVAAWLSDYRLVVCWLDQSSHTVVGRLFNANGSAASAEFTVSPAAVYSGAVVVKALDDGGFVTAFDIGGGRTIQYFDAGGVKQGAGFTVPSVYSDSDATGFDILNDGRLALTWNNTFSGLRVQIVDPRDGSVISNEGGVAFGHFTADDEIRGSAVSDTFYGLGGDDVLYGYGGADRLFGGQGQDTAMFQATSAQATVTRLAHGSLRVSAVNESTQLRGVEHIELADRSLDVRGYAASDVNGDGDSDIVLYSQSTGIVTRLDMQDGFQIGGGEVGRMGSGAWRVQQTGDFNYDANSDLVLKNTSTGQFYIWTQFGGVQNSGKDLGVIGTSWDVVSTGDYNADGAFDILWRNGANGQFYVWTFNSAMTQTGSANLGILGTNWTGGPSGDFDGDGDSDVLLRNTTNGQFYVYTMQNGAQAGGVNLGILGTDWTIAEVGDFNGDMRSDIALKNTSTGQFYLWLMNADLTYTGANLGTIGTDWNIAATGDYNADGTDDLLWRNASTGQTYVWSMQEGRQADTGSHHLGFLSSDLIIV